MKIFLQVLLLILISTASFSQLTPVVKLSTNRKNESPVNFATIFKNKYLYNKLTYNADGKASNELWITDGTETGTTLLTNAAGDFLSGGTVGNQFIFFKSNYAADGTTLVYDCWKTDGTSNGTVLLKTTVASGSYNDGSSYTTRPKNSTLLKDQLYFVTNGGTDHQQLWKTNGTAIDTVKSDFTGLSYFKGLHDLVVLNNQLYFLINDPNANNDTTTIWKTDGTYAGTVPVFSGNDKTFLQPDFAGSVEYHGQLLFAATDSKRGRELWITDGTATGTKLYLDLMKGPESSYPTDITLIGNKLFFVENYGSWLAALDLSNNQISVLAERNNGAFGMLLKMGDKLVFKLGDTRRGLEWFISDGTAGGTKLLADIRLGAGSPFDFLSYETEITAATPGGKMFFAANDGIHGNELWSSDLTASNTKLFADIAPGSAWSSPTYIKASADKLFFVAYDKTNWQVYAMGQADAPPPSNNYVPFKQGEWLQTFGAKNYIGTGYFNYLEGLTTDRKNNVYLCGHFLSPDNDLVFYDSDTIATGNKKYEGFTYKDYLVKLSPDGQFRWYKNNGGSDFFAYTALTVDKNDEVLAAGGATPPIFFDSTVLNNQQGVYLAKYDTAGNTKWYKIFNTGRFANIEHLTTDAANNIIVGGIYKNGFIDMGNGVGASSLYDGQYFAAKTDADGRPLWVANIPVYAGFQGYIKRIISDENTNIYVLTTLFAPNTTTTGCITDTTYIQVTKFSSTGRLIWNKKMNAVGVINALSLTIDAAGLLNVMGYFGGHALIDKYSFYSGNFNGCYLYEIIHVQMNASDGRVTGAAKAKNQLTNVLDIKANNDGTYYLLGYKINKDQQPKMAGFEISPYNSPTQQLVLEHRFYNGQMIDTKTWNVGSETVFNRSYFATTTQNDFIIATSGAQYIDTFANGVSNYNTNTSVWKYINQFTTPVVPVIPSLSDIKVLNNPAGDKLILSLPGTGVGGQVNIYNSMGQLIQQQQINAGLTIITIDVANLSRGVYFVSVPVANGRQTIKFLKM